MKVFHGMINNCPVFLLNRFFDSDLPVGDGSFEEEELWSNPISVVQIVSTGHRCVSKKATENL